MTTASPGITIVGLGPGDPEARTVGAQRALDAADRIILRTRIHPGIADLAGDVRVSDCDDLYERADGFDQLYPAIAARVLDAAKESGRVVFAVPGHPRFGERVVPLIEAGGRERGIAVWVMAAVSFLDATVAALGVDPLAGGLQIADAEALAATLDRDPFAAGMLGVDPARPLLVAQVYNGELAAAVKIALARVYPNEHVVTLVRGAGIAGEEGMTDVPLHALDRQPVDHLTSLWVPALPALEAVRSADALIQVVARLRAPGGCPWDREQTHASLRNAVLEEAYEVVAAIDDEDGDGLAEELGDLLLIVAMQAQLGEEAGTFSIEDVYEGITRKIVRRHPHVFGSATAETPDAVIATWEGVKAEERRAKGKSAREENRLDRLPRAMPSTRKVIEIVAPRTTLRGPDDAGDGDLALAAIRALIEAGIDPERAIERSLRRIAASGDDEVSRPEAEPAAAHAGRGLA